MNFNFLTNGTLDRADPIEQRRRHMAEIRREGFRQKIKHIADDTEQAVDYCRDLMRSGADVTEELKKMQVTANGLMLVAALLQREAEKV